MPVSASGSQLQLWAGTPGWPGEGRKSWQAEAACRQLPTDLFFPVGHGPRAQAQTRLAKEICAACGVRPQCLAHALVCNARYGVFGGLAEDERRELRRRLDEGHPRDALGAGGATAEADWEESA